MKRTKEEKIRKPKETEIKTKIFNNRHSNLKNDYHLIIKNFPFKPSKTRIHNLKNHSVLCQAAVLPGSYVWVVY